MPFTDHDGVRLHWDEQGAGTPVLLVMGATDTVPGARHLTYPGAGHNYILDSAGAATKDVLAFFDDVDAGQPT